MYENGVAICHIVSMAGSKILPILYFRSTEFRITFAYPCPDKRVYGSLSLLRKGPERSSTVRSCCAGKTVISYKERADTPLTVTICLLGQQCLQDIAVVNLYK